MKKVVGLLAMSLALFGGTQAMAKDISFTTEFTQAQFKEFTKEAGAAISYRNAAPAEPLGITGFEIGLEVSAADVSGSEHMNRAFGGDAPAYVALPKLRARKGLPLGIDVGAMYSYVPDSNIKLWGVEISKAILEGTAATPALGVRGTYTRLTGVGDLDLQTAGIDASISKGFLILTPYAGAGGVWVSSEAKGNFSSLGSEDEFQPRYFAGLQVAPLPLVSLVGEVEYQERLIYTLKASIGF